MVSDNRNILSNMHLFDGESGKLQYNRSVLVEGGKIVSVQSDSATLDTYGHTLIDLRGLTLLPGLIDAHVHITAPFMDRVTFRSAFTMGLQMERNARVCVESGITTVRDAGGFHRKLDSLISAINSSDLPGPRIIRCNSCISSPGGYPDHEPYFTPFAGVVAGNRRIERAGTPEEARARVEEMIRLGAEWIKVCCQHRSLLPGRGELPVLGPDTFQALVRTARKYGRKVCCHISRLQDLKYAMSMGVDTFEHSPIDEIDDRTAIELAARNMVLNPTLASLNREDEAAWESLDSIVAGRGKTLLEPEPLRQVREHIALFRKEAFQQPEHRHHAGSFPVRTFQKAFANVGRVLRAGGRVGVATNAGGTLTAFFGESYVEELRHLRQTGLTPAQVLTAATSGNASILGLGGTVGAIRPGMDADLIAVEGNPLDDLQCIRNVKVVMKGGRFIVGGPGGDKLRVLSKWRRN